MKNILTKLSYMAFGCLLTIIGYHFGNIDNNNADAQTSFMPVPIDDRILCRRLIIVGKDNTPRITLEADRFDRGKIEIGDEHRIRRVYLGIDAVDGVEGGAIELSAKGSDISASLGTEGLKRHTSSSSILSLRVSD